MELVRADNISKKYLDGNSTIKVLSGINFAVNTGETIAVTGESGSGKSTMLHLLGLLDDCSEGSIYFYNKLIPANEVPAFRNSKIGFVFQFHYLLEDFTACENIAMPKFIASGDWNKSIASAKILLEKVDMQHREKHYPNQLSGGEQQRIAVARALINKPDIILADEPTGNLDARHSDEIIDLILSLNAEVGSSLVIVTHNMEIAEKMDKHFVLRAGELKLLD